MRLVGAARGLVYGEKITWSGPAPRALAIEGSRARVRFEQLLVGIGPRGMTRTDEPGLQ